MFRTVIRIHTNGCLQKLNISILLFVVKRVSQRCAGHYCYAINPKFSNNLNNIVHPHLLSINTIQVKFLHALLLQ